MMELAIGSTNTVEVFDLIDTVTGDYVDDYAVVATLTDLQTGEEVVGETWPVTLVSEGNGVYRTQLSATMVLNKNKQYLLDTTAAKGAVVANWQTTCSAVVKES